MLTDIDKAIGIQQISIFIAKYKNHLLKIAQSLLPKANELMLDVLL